MLYHFGDCVLDDQLYQLSRDGAPIEIEPKVFDVLAYLLHHHDRVVSKDELLEKLWPGQVVSETALTRCIVAARKAVGDDGGKQQIIKTQHGRGYRFIAEVVSSQHSVVSREEGQTGDDEDSLESSVQSLESNGQRLESEVQRKTVTDQTLDPRLNDSRLSDPQRQTLDDSSDQTLDARRRTLDATAPSVQRLWSIRAFILLGLVLLVGIIVVVQYLSLPTPTPQSLSPNTQSLPLPDKPSIVVLPFTNLSGDPAQEYFSDGITEDLTSGLSRISSLFVISRHSAFTYKGKAVKVQEVSKELGVRYVLEGSVRRAEDQIRITTQLIDATTGYHL
jgi:TolB-like protein/DNA-binding winged helix-turn-helix (wHTH) protein